MYTINGKFIKSIPEKKPLINTKNNKKIIEHMDNSIASFNSLQFHDKDSQPATLKYIKDRIILSKENKNGPMTTMLDIDFANDALSIYSNLTVQNNLIFYPDSEDNKKGELNKGLIFYNKDKKIVGAFHKDGKDKSDLVFRTGNSDESAFGLTERLRIHNAENRVSVKGSIDAEQLCLGSTCINKGDLDKLKKALG